MRSVACALAAWLLLAAAPSALPQETVKFQDVKVRPGDTLWSISRTYLKDPQQWSEILRYNKLPNSDPTVALPGMILKVPIALIKEELRAADLVEKVHQVLARKKDNPDWKDAELHMTLYRDDTLQTRADSKAQVRFSNGELLSLDENTMAVLKPRKRDDADLELQRGQIAASKARVVTSSARITPETPGTKYIASVREDLSTKVAVVAGQATVEGSGKKVTVAAGFQTSVALGLAPAAPAPIPDLPGLTAQFQELASFEAPAPKSLSVVKTAAVAPADSSDFEKKLRAPAIGLPVKSYHLQASTNKEFTRLSVDRYFEADERMDVDAVGLQPGAYWWRVAVVDLMGAEGKFAPAFQYSVR